MSNEKIIKEFKKFNQDLEKHLPNLDLDFLKENQESLEESSPTDDILTLLVNTVNDMKTELALTKRNLADNIEGMVLRVINQDHNLFAKQISETNAKYVASIRDSLGSYIAQLNEELSVIRKEFNKMTISNQKMTSEFAQYKDELKSLNISFDTLKDNQKKFDRSQKIIKEKVNSIDDLMNSFKDNKIISEKEIKHLESDIVKNRKKIDEIKKIEQKRSNIAIKEVIIEPQQQINTSFQPQANNNTLNDEPMSIIKNEVMSMTNSNYSPQDNLHKMLSIEKRLEKLNSLK